MQVKQRKKGNKKNIEMQTETTIGSPGSGSFKGKILMIFFPTPSLFTTHIVRIYCRMHNVHTWVLELTMEHFKLLLIIYIIIKRIFFNVFSLIVVTNLIMGQHLTFSNQSYMQGEGSKILNSIFKSKYEKEGAGNIAIYFLNQLNNSQLKIIKTLTNLSW